MRLAVALVAATVLVGLGHRLAAVVLVAVVGAVTTTSLASPASARALERGTGALQRGVALVLGVVLLGAVHLLVFTPVALVLRLLRRDPLRRGLPDDAPTFWRPALPPGRRPLHRRQFSRERRPAQRSGDRLPLPRLRAALGLLVVLGLVDLGLGTAVDAIRDDPPPVTLGAVPVPDVGAAEGEPWAPVVFEEVTRAFAERRFDPFLGWRMPDFDGVEVHAEGGVRRTYTPASAIGDDAVVVYVFGGSTTWGNYQRDDHTIPSELARLAEADGLPVRFVNHGQQAYVGWQEVGLLTQLVTSGDVPDLAVFYDGVNELIAQGFVGPFTEPTHMQARLLERSFVNEAADRQLDDEPSWADAARDAYVERSAVARVVRTVRSAVDGGELVAPPPGEIISPWAPGQREQAEERARNAVAVHRRGVELATTLAERYGFDTAFFWQPTLYSKDVVPGEEGVAGSWGEDPEAWRTITDVSRAGLAAPVVDISDALDGVEEPVMYDFHHTNEAGAAAIARALYAELRPQLVALAGR